MSWLRDYIPIMAARASGQESTVRVSETISVVTRVKIQVHQAIVTFFSLVALMVGMYLMLDGMFKAACITGVDVVSVMLILAFVGFAGFTIMRAFFQDIASRPVTRAVGLAGLLLAVSLPVAAVTKLSREGEYVDLALFVLGAALFYAGGLLTHNMTKSLLDPMGDTSPWERATAPPTIAVLEAIAEEIKHRDEPDEHPIIIRTEKGEYVASTDELGMKGDKIREWAPFLLAADGQLQEDLWGNTDFFTSYPHFRGVRGNLVKRELAEKDGSTYKLTHGGISMMESIAGERGGTKHTVGEVDE